MGTIDKHLHAHPGGKAGRLLIKLISSEFCFFLLCAPILDSRAESGAIDGAECIMRRSETKFYIAFFFILKMEKNRTKRGLLKVWCLSQWYDIVWAVEVSTYSGMYCRVPRFLRKTRSILIYWREAGTSKAN